MADLNNWGRWGEHDQRGQLNILTSDHILSALRLAQKGVVYNLAVPLHEDGPQFPEFHRTWRVTHYENDPAPGGFGIADDVVTMETHSGTHVDALGHAWRDGMMFNGKDWTEGVSSRGVTWGAIENIGSIVSRGVMLDVAAQQGVESLGVADVVSPELLEATAQHQGVDVRPGDVVLVRTGWYRHFAGDRELWASGQPGPDGSLGPWLKEKDVVALGADTPAVEVIRSHPVGDLPLHATALRDLGIYLFENVDLDELAKDHEYEFLFIAAPLRYLGATGSGVTPLAIV